MDLPVAADDAGRYRLEGRTQPHDGGRQEQKADRGRERRVGHVAIVSWALNRLVGTNFHVVSGYEMQTPQLLAMERGELEGVGSTALRDILAKEDWIKNDKVAFLYSISTAQPPIAGRPDYRRVRQNDLDRSVLRLLASVTDLGFNTHGSAGHPRRAKATRRKAFSELVKDKDFLAEAAKAELSRSPCPAKSCRKSSPIRSARRATS